MKVHFKVVIFSIKVALSSFIILITIIVPTLDNFIQTTHDLKTRHALKLRSGRKVIKILMNSSFEIPKPIIKINPPRRKRQKIPRIKNYKAWQNSNCTPIFFLGGSTDIALLLKHQPPRYIFPRNFSMNQFADSDKEVCWFVDHTRKIMSSVTEPEIF